MQDARYNAQRTHKAESNKNTENELEIKHDASTNPWDS